MVNDEGYSVYVGEIGQDVTDEDLFAAFSSFGPILSARVIKEAPDYTVSRGFGFVNFASEEVRQQVVLMHRKMEVKGNVVALRVGRKKNAAVIGNPAAGFYGAAVTPQLPAPYYQQFAAQQAAALYNPYSAVGGVYANPGYSYQPVVYNSAESYFKSAQGTGAAAAATATSASPANGAGTAYVPGSASLAPPASSTYPSSAPSAAAAAAPSYTAPSYGSLSQASGAPPPVPSSAASRQSNGASGWTTVSPSSAPGAAAGKATDPPRRKSRFAPY